MSDRAELMAKLEEARRQYLATCKYEYENNGLDLNAEMAVLKAAFRKRAREIAKARKEATK